MLPKPSRWSQEGTYVQMLFGGADRLVLGIHEHGCFNNIREYPLQKIAAMPHPYRKIPIQEHVEEDFGRLVPVLEQLCEAVKELENVTITFSGRPGDPLEIRRKSEIPLQTEESAQSLRMIISGYLWSLLSFLQYIFSFFLPFLPVPKVRGKISQAHAAHRKKGKKKHK